MKRWTWLVLGAAAMVFIFGCGGPSGDGGGSGGGGNGSSGGAGRTNPMQATLTEAELQKHLQTLRGLYEISESAEKDPNAIRQTAEVTAYMASKGMAWETFWKTHMKVIGAFSAMAYRDAIAKAKAEGAPDPAIRMMEASAVAYKDVPDENVELARKYQQQLKDLGVKKDQSPD